MTWCTPFLENIRNLCRRDRTSIHCPDNDVMGPLIVGLDKPVQIVQLGAKDTDIVNMAALAAFNIGG